VQERGDELDRQEASEGQADDGQEDADTCVHYGHSLFVGHGIGGGGSDAGQADMLVQRVLVCIAPLGFGDRTDWTTRIRRDLGLLRQGPAADQSQMKLHLFRTVSTSFTQKLTSSPHREGTKAQTDSHLSWGSGQKRVVVSDRGR
jgi:hypothetical protein